MIAKLVIEMYFRLFCTALHTFHLCQMWGVFVHSAVAQCECEFNLSSPVSCKQGACEAVYKNILEAFWEVWAARSSLHCGFCSVNHTPHGFKELWNLRAVRSSG